MGRAGLGGEQHWAGGTLNVSRRMEGQRTTLSVGSELGEGGSQAAEGFRPLRDERRLPRGECQLGESEPRDKALAEQETEK